MFKAWFAPRAIPLTARDITGKAIKSKRLANTMSNIRAQQLWFVATSQPDSLAHNSVIIWHWYFIIIVEYSWFMLELAVSKNECVWKNENPNKCVLMRLWAEDKILYLKDSFLSYTKTPRYPWMAKLFWFNVHIIYFLNIFFPPKNHQKYLKRSVSIS